LNGENQYELFLSREGLVSKILTTKELAEYLKLTEVTIYKYANEGKIPGFKIGSRWRFDKEKIDDLLKCEDGEIAKQN
jgi:excisionase family DNA binding protein